MIGVIGKNLATLFASREFPDFGQPPQMAITHLIWRNFSWDWSIIFLEAKKCGFTWP